MDEMRMDTFLNKGVQQSYEKYAIIKSGLYANIRSLEKKMIVKEGE